MTDLLPEYLYQKEASKYLMTTERKIAIFRKYGMLKCAKLGKNYVYRREWLDSFMEEWSGFDLSNEEKIKLAIHSKEWHETHDRK